ncbi:MAG TPA: hypothetical protein VD814_06620 [Nocardioides sp.]|nr:hypothetical protein [Nocardioides sp.]
MNTRTAPSSVRRRVAAWALLPLLSLAAACGGEEPAEDASSSTSPAESSESSESTDASGGESAAGGTHDVDSILPAMRAALEEAPSARVKMELTGTAEMTMEGRMAMTDRFEDGEMELTLAIQGQRLDLRLVDGLVYLSGPPLTPPGKWVSADPKDPQDPVGQQFGSLVTSGDLRSTFDAFEAGLREVESVGNEQIDGESVEHYVFTVDSAAAAEAQGQPVQPGMPEQVDYDVWLTEEDLMRRVTFDLGGVGAVLDATEWGEPVDIEAPAPADVVKRPAG